MSKNYYCIREPADKCLDCSPNCPNSDAYVEGSPALAADKPLNHGMLTVILIAVSIAFGLPGLCAGWCWACASRNFADGRKAYARFVAKIDADLFDT